MQTLFLALHVVLALGIIGLVLIQQGKGAEAGASFGGGASGTVFGSLGPVGFLGKMTALLVALFFATSLTLAYFAKQQYSSLNGMEMGVPSQEVIEELEQERARLPLFDDVE